MIRRFARPLSVVAGAGWALCVVVGSLAIAGIQSPAFVVMALFVGVFPLQLCGVLLLQQQVGGMPRGGDLWKIAFRGCPDWLRYAIWASWAFAFICFFTMASGSAEPSLDGRMAGFAAAFYSVNCGIFVTAVATRDEPTECANGHAISALDKFCSECGAEIKRTNSVRS